MRLALVTGVSSGTGKRLVEVLVQSGWEVVGVSRSEPGLGRVWPQFRWHCMDLSDPRYTYGLDNAIGQRALDLLAHCAPEGLLAGVLEEVGHRVVGGVLTCQQVQQVLESPGQPILTGLSAAPATSGG